MRLKSGILIAFGMVIAFSSSPVAAASADSCTVTGGVYPISDRGEPYVDGPVRNEMWHGIGSHSSHTDREENKAIAETNENFNAYIINSADGQCGGEVTFDLNLECGENLECEFRNSGDDSIEVSTSVGTVRKEPIKVKASADLPESTEDLTRSEAEEIKKKMNGPVSVKWDTEADTPENLKKASAAAFTPGDLERGSILQFVEWDKYYTTYLSQSDSREGYAGSIQVDADTHHDFAPFVWGTAYARAVDSSPEELDDFEKLDVYRSTDEMDSSPEGWMEPSEYNDPKIDLSTLSKDEEWVIFPASCISKQESEYYREEVGAQYFHLIHTGISNDQWVCGFNKPLYLPSVTSNQPPAFE